MLIEIFNMSQSRLALLTVMLIAGLQVCNAMNPTGPICNETVHKRPALGLLLAKLDPLPSAQVCSWLLTNFCNRLSVVEWGLEMAGNASSPCEPEQEPLSGRIYPFLDERPLPGVLQDPPAFYEAEGPTFFWLWTVIRNIYAIAPCGHLEQLKIPKGWTLKTLFDLSQNGAPPMVLGAVLLQPSRRQLAVVLRGTMTQWEWQLNLSFNQSKEAPFDAPVHWGFNLIFQEIWPTVAAQLDWLVPNAADEVFVAGHSLGGGVGTLLAYAIQDHLELRLGKEHAPVVSAALFAPPNVGPAEFVGKFNERVNARRIAFRDDAVPQVPCTPSFPACSTASLTGGFQLLGDTLIPTNEPGDVDSWAFKQIGGSLTVMPGDMPQDSSAWETLRELQVCWAPQFITATHSCSYTCFVSRFATHRSDWGADCWLGSKPEKAHGTYCPGWPNNYPRMPGDGPGKRKGGPKLVVKGKPGMIAFT